MQFQYNEIFNIFIERGNNFIAFLERASKPETDLAHSSCNDGGLVFR